jgi:hypothetical protein
MPLLLLGRIGALALAPAASVLDLADPSVSLRYWLQHPTLGEAGFDSTVAHEGNPIYVGQPPWTWPVNGRLGGSFRNKPTVMYIGLYQQGYGAGNHTCNYTGDAYTAPPGGCSAAMLKLNSDDHGKSWQVDISGPNAQPLVCNGDPSGPDKGTGCPDGSTALDPDTGGVHLIWDYNQALGDSGVPHAGLGHSYAPPGAGCLDTGVECPGEFVRSPVALNDAVNNTPLDHGFVKLYAGTLIRRKTDWLIVSAIGGGSWGLAAMTSANAAGPFTPPALLLWPQSDVYHPEPSEPCKHMCNPPAGEVSSITLHTTDTWATTM